VVCGTLWLPGDKPWLGPLLALIAVSLWDDRGEFIRPCAWRARGCAARGVACRTGMDWLVAVVAIVWMTNLYNFMDGSDGLAGAMTMVGFARTRRGLLPGSATRSWRLWQPRPHHSSCATFPAQIFLAMWARYGFLAAIFGITGGATDGGRDGFRACLPPFIADATVTLGRRLLRGAKVWEAHREHFYQRLVQSGWGHGRTLAFHALLMIGTAGSAVAALAWTPVLGVPLLIGWAAVLVFIYAGIEYHWRRRRSPGGDESKC
jgi:UDP-N-acetylmuramyl pentapeptide phosphotransferase/UDP-N-acetylglucosamine-1-phosphate transferase